MTKVYFVRHAQPDHHNTDDRNRPLTQEGMTDTDLVLNVLKDKKIDMFYCSPYKRSIDTIKSTADYYGMKIITDERLRERKAGKDGNVKGMFQKRWADMNYHEEDGESIGMVQERNIEALTEILQTNKDKNIVIGTHGTALSSIMNYYNRSFGCDDFMRIIDWMPYIVEMDFEKDRLVNTYEIAHIHKSYN
ncbi:MAG: histidine phosphatase family protein [Lachnospiraceae bacterium]|nr:histidine phosphatase family protein [Lachnospiraceae bacterium]